MHIKRMHEMIECLTEYGKCMIEAGTGDGKVNLCDAGQVVDMIKDLSDAEYHARIAKAMEKEEEDEKEEEKYMLRMLKEEHGMSEEDSRRFYDAWRYKSGRFAPKGRGTRRGYDEPPYYHMTPDMMREHDPEYWRDMDRRTGKMYYTDASMTGNAPTTTTGNDGNVRGYSDGYADGMKDGRKSGESRYDRARRGYQETKAMHKGNTPEDKQITMREAEKMLNVVFDEIDEMLEDATPEMKNMVKTKGMTRFQKIQ